MASLPITWILHPAYSACLQLESVTVQFINDLPNAKATDFPKMLQKKTLSKLYILAGPWNAMRGVAAWALPVTGRCVWHRATPVGVCDFLPPFSYLEVHLSLRLVSCPWCTETATLITYCNASSNLLLLKLHLDFTYCLFVCYLDKTSPFQKWSSSPVGLPSLFYHICVFLKWLLLIPYVQFHFVFFKSSIIPLRAQS